MTNDREVLRLREEITISVNNRDIESARELIEAKYVKICQLKYRK